MLNTEPTSQLGFTPLYPPADLSTLHLQLSDTLKSFDPLLLIVAAVVSTLLLSQLYSQLIKAMKYCGNLRVNMKITLFNILVWLPCGRRYL